jgi:AraC family transcriptional regulator of adaptative response/methylated-DNA-[protein]-cysteine methyltransferase
MATTGWTAMFDANLFDSMSTPDHDKRVLAVRARDAAADGQFFYAVLTTGVFCYPSCAARPARPENLRFFDTRHAAEQAGYRPCRRCRPDLPPRAERHPALVQAACRDMQAGQFDLPAAAAAAGMGAPAFVKLFRKITGITPTAFAAAQRAQAARNALAGDGSVTDAMYQAGFSSSGRFYESVGGMLGMTPTAWRDGGAGETLRVATGASALGCVLVAATDRGICAILLGDEAASLHAELRARFPRAALLGADAAFRDRVAEVVALIETPSAGHALQLDIRGTAFQHRVWQALTRISPGKTATYGQIATALGVPGGARAVGAACAANRVAVAIPCHRVVDGAGGLAGYAWGRPRKAALLARERDGSERAEKIKSASGLG